MHACNVDIELHISYLKNDDAIHVSILWVEKGEKYETSKNYLQKY